MEKICGNCVRYFEVRPSLHQGQCLIEENDEHGCARIHNESDSACINWIKVPLHLEERYKALAKVAKEMLEEIRSCQDDGGWWHNADDFENQLKELGVIVDG